MPTRITTPTGRIVWGTPHVRQAVIDDKTKVQAIDVKTGQPIWEYAYGLAIPKDQIGNIWQAQTIEAAKVCNGVVPPYAPDAKDSFAYKMIDGDSMAPAVPARGIPARPYSEREGYAGCWVFAIKSRLPNPPPVFDWIDGRWQQVDPTNLRGGNELKTGDYVQTGLSIDGHGGQSPGLYLNPEGIQFVGFGTLIQRGPDAAAMFGAAGPAQLPAGASSSPVGGAPAGAAPMAMPGQPAPVAPQPGFTPAPVAAPGPASPAPAPTAGPSPAPQPGMIASPTSQPMPGMAAPAPVPGFSTGQPAAAPAPAPAPAPVPAAPQARVQAGTDAAGRPYYFKADGSGQTEY